jgi:tetratricopeptide (TPR) repeat protein
VQSTSELLAQGVQLHQRGAVHEAEQLYREVLQVEPHNPEALFYFGIAAQQLGQPEVGVDSISRAIALRPGVAAFHCYLGLAYWALGRQPDALAAYQDAIRLDPNYADAHNNLGVALQRLGRMAEATVCFEEAVRCNPNFAEACSNLGAAYQDQGRLSEAIASFEHAVRCKPDFAAAHNNLGVVSLAEGRLEQAVACSREAVRLQPDYAEAHYNLGLALKRMDRFEEAVGAFQQALRVRPGYADAYNDLGLTYHMQGRLKEALACFDEAIRVRPDFADAHLAKASTLLMAGDFKAGWQEYEWRWRCEGFVAPPLRSPRPAWEGSALGGRTLLLRAEQGFGDTFQFIRYAPLLKERGARVVFEAQLRLLPLLKHCSGIDRLFALGDEPPSHDLHAYLLSMPRLLGTTLDTMPAKVPYLGADPDLIAKWRQELQADRGFKIGISWQGNPTQKADRQRSFPLSALAPLADLNGVRLISIQKGPGTEQIDDAGQRLRVIDLGNRLDETAGAFMDTAAVLMSLDLVITVDSAVAHLAGALGVPVWVPLSFSPDWRWLLERGDSPWYPTMRLFRQRRIGDWTEVFQRMQGALRDVVSGGTQAVPQRTCSVEIPAASRLELQKPLILGEPGALNPREIEAPTPPPEANAPGSTAFAPKNPSPEPVDPYNLMGAALLAQGKLEAAAALWEQALGANPRSADGHNNLGVCLSRLGKPEEALESFRRALALKPRFAEAYTNMGTAFGAQGKLDEAQACFDEALRLRPDFAEAHLARAQGRLLVGDFEHGWPEHEWRARCPAFGAHYYATSPQPTWDGSPLQGQTILLRAEQGLGDTIQFERYAPLVQERGGRVIVEAQSRLLSLLSTCPGVSEVACQGEILPPFDVQALLLSLPLIFGTTLATVPADIPYLSADQALVKQWRQRLASIDVFKVGIVWQGQAANPLDRLRSVALSQFDGLAAIEGVHLFGLQVGEGREQLTAVHGRFPVTDLGGQFDPDSFADIAAAIINMDLIITVDTAVAHLAGALGVPIWLAISTSPDWRWLLEREDSPWYPSMRLFRQSELGRWDDVFARMATHLRQKVASGAIER